jgi:two-component system response regulator FixJ
MTTKPTIHVIDDDAAVRDSLAFLLDVQGFSSQIHESAVEFLDGIASYSLDCIVTDIRMPDMTGLELVEKLKELGFACPVIVITGHGDVPLAVEAMKAGVVDFIEKPFSDDVFLDAIRSALEKAQLDPDNARSDALERLTSLTPRERDVLVGVVAGKANKVIAHDLGISPRTVEIYRANLMSKTSARSVAELMRIAVAAGL